MAAATLANLPTSLIELCESDKWKGGPLLVMASTVARPSAQDVATNHVWLRPMVLQSPHKAMDFVRECLFHAKMFPTYGHLPKQKTVVLAF